MKVFSIVVLLGMIVQVWPAFARDGLAVTSPAFMEGGMIPVKYTCKGTNISPALSWKGAPAGARSFVLICNDPDAPAGNWMHWIVYNIPPGISRIPAGFQKVSEMADGTMQARTSFGTTGYGGPCPPSGVHRYYFTVYALDIKLDLNPAEASYTDVVKAMQGHIIASGRLMGKFKK